jgi:hypothetical protein
MHLPAGERLPSATPAANRRRQFYRRASITADRLVRYFERADYAVMQKPPLGEFWIGARPDERAPKLFGLGALVQSCLQPQARRNDWRRLVRRTAPPNPSAIIAQVESSGTAATGKFASMSVLGVVSNP